MLLGLAVAVVGCERLPDRAPELSELQAGEGAKRSGKWLMLLPEGMNRLDPHAGAPQTIDVVVHGYDSRGYEWVHALKRFGDLGHEVVFYRWDWNVCPKEGALRLREQLKVLLEARPQAKKLRVFGHSYGGVITALMARDGGLSLPMEAHLIAAPLAGMGRMKSLCGYEGLGGVSAHKDVAWFQWRTQHQLDGAFRDEPVDPQVVELGLGKVQTLPDSYEGRRLGHNWSISWVVDHLSASSGGVR